MNQKDTVIVSIDFQERLVPAMVDSKPMIEEAVKLLKGANILGIPVLFTQQYTRGLGDTVPEIKDVCPEFSYIEKQSFSVAGAKEFCERLDELKPKNIIIIGIETHICVLQSALDLLDKGFTERGGHLRLRRILPLNRPAGPHSPPPASPSTRTRCRKETTCVVRISS